MRIVLPLSEVTRHDLAVAGGKGANLGELVRAGFPVPPGFVVTTAAYDAAVDAAGIRDAITALASASDPDGSAGEAIRRLFDAPVPADIADAVTGAYAELGPDAVVAVRSSATAEDLAEASFAGQQDTYLGVRGTEAVLDAVRRCWASLWTDRALAYRARADIDPARVSLAVVVQRLVDADAAGVLFTANPATGRRTETVINAAFGLGEALVGGEVTPDELTVEQGRVTARTTADKRVRTVLAAGGGTRLAEQAPVRRTAAVLTDAEAVELAALGGRVADHVGSPQDIEWVRADGAFALVQARPITALPAPSGPVPTDWSVPRHDGMYIRGSIIEQLPDPLSPLFTDLIRPAVRDSLAQVLQRYLPGVAVREGDTDLAVVNGYGYYFYTNEGMKRLFRAAPQGVVQVFRPGAANGVEYWRTTGLPTYRRVVADWSARDPDGLSDADLLAGAAALVDAGAVYYTTVQAVIPPTATAEIAFTKLYDATARRPGDPPAATFLIGFDSEPIRAERSVAALAAWCRSRPGVADAVLAGTDLPAEARGEFDALLADHLARYGHLTYNLDLMQPVAADDPAPVLAALRFALGDASTDPAERQARLARDRRRAERELFARLDPVRRTLLERTLRRAQELGPIREDALAAIGLGWPAARRFLRTLGARLVDAGVLAERDDIFWLRRAEVEAAASDPRPRQAEVEARKETWRGQRLAHPPGWLPAEGFFYELFKRYMPGNEAEQTGPTLQGLGSSGGTVTGPARVLRGPEDFGSMRPGEILVAAITTPAFTPFFAMAAGVVTDIGGPLSHSSIVAREYGIPAVLGTGSATARIATGDTITVDGDDGLVLLDANTAGVTPPEAQTRGRPGAGVLVAAGVGVAAVAAGVSALVWRRRPRG